jgi:ATP-binding cassette subfamily C (CFTR/MRP) protein 1
LTVIIAATNDDQLDVESRPGDISVYRYYLRSVGAANMLALLTCTALYSFFSIFPHYWIKWWTEAGSDKDVFYMLGYLLSSTIAWASTSGTLWINFIKLAPRSGAVLHSSLLSTVLRAPLSYFINNDIGTIVNRFSQDIKLIDRDLPSALAALCTQIFKIMMQCSLLLASQRLLVFTLPIYCFFIYIIQKVYLRTSRQLRYLELESRSAVYSSFLETVEGLVTIRAFGWQQSYLERNTRSLDLSQRAFYLFLCLQRWLNVTLDLAVAFIAIMVISLAVFYSTDDASADVGIALNMVLVTNTTLLRLIESWTTLEVSVGAAARLKELEDCVPNEEECAVETIVPCDWPSAGSLTLRGVRVCYG